MFITQEPPWGRQPAKQISRKGIGKEFDFNRIDYRRSFLELTWSDKYCAYEIVIDFHMHKNYMQFVTYFRDLASCDHSHCLSTVIRKTYLGVGWALLLRNFNRFSHA